MDKSIEELIYEETDQRLKEMSSSSYIFPQRATRTDYSGILIVVCACLVLILLCMTGVIE